MTSPEYKIHIEELVLRGFDGPLAGAEGRARIGAAVQRELARLFAERGMPPSLSRGGHRGQLDGGTFDLAPGPTAEAVGGQIAQALYQGFSQ